MSRVRYDYVVVGAGPSGATFAECAARVEGARVLIVDRRNHVAGNCYDTTHGDTGLLVHAYGPHYMRFTDRSVFDYVSRFTSWLPGNYIVKASLDGKLVPIPINLETLELVYELGPLDETSGARLLERERVPIHEPQNSEEFVLSRVGQLLYNLLYRGYTEKQWGLQPSELAVEVCGRVPIRLNRDSRYSDAPIQVMPRDGYTSLFERMLSNPRIDVAVDTDWLSDRRYGTSATVFTGPIDEYFGQRLGPLQWRSLRFEVDVYDKAWHQPTVQVNYPGDEPYTRTVEYKHVTRQVHPRTAVSKEYALSTGEPFYPVPSLNARNHYEEYRDLAEQAKETEGVCFLGRLACYTYINMDEAIGQALRAYAELAGRSPLAS